MSRFYDRDDTEDTMSYLKNHPEDVAAKYTRQKVLILDGMYAGEQGRVIGLAKCQYGNKPRYAIQLFIGKIVTMTEDSFDVLQHRRY